MQIFNRRVLALETNPFLTKGLLLRLSGKKVKVLKKIMKAHPSFTDEIVSDTQITHFKNAIEALSPDAEDFVVLNFPSEKLITSVQQMPDLSEEQLANAIKFKMSEDFTIPVSELVVQVARPIREAKTLLEKTRHLAFATKRKSLDQYLSRLFSEGRSPEPDVLLPDSMKYFELIDSKTFLGNMKPGNHFCFLACMDIQYSLLFSFLDGSIYNVTEIPMTIKTLLDRLRGMSIDVEEVLTAIAQGSEIGSLGYVKDIEPAIDEIYRNFLFETEKAMRLVLNNSQIANAINQVDALYLLSLNHRLTLDLEMIARNMRLLNGTPIVRIPLKQDFPEDLDLYRTVVGLSYRGIREIGNYKFIRETERGGSGFGKHKPLQKQKTKV
ncbi:MAG: hypothetical protein GXY29_07760 [Thermotogaceae bacterium]|nr:hypothetical protein [Thermotogaceae bacterium]